MRHPNALSGRTPGCYLLQATAFLLIAVCWQTSPGQQAGVLPVPDGLVPPAVQAPQPFTPPGELRVRVRDVITVQGHRSNPLEGQGLVTGLNGTGDNSIATQQAASNLGKRSANLNAPSKSKNISRVLLTADLPPFVRSGEEIDVTVAVLDSASDLKGGVLANTPLYGPDGEIYATAHGPLVTGGFSVGGDAASVQKNHPTVARVRATVEKEVCTDLCQNDGTMNLLLRNKDELTASRIAAAINLMMPNHARATDPGTVQVYVPENFRQRQTEFLAMIGSLQVVPNMPARVVINERTGTIVIGANVRLSRVVFANSNLVVTTAESPVVSQPNAFSGGETTVVPRTQLTAVEQGGRYNLLSEGIEVGQLAEALNAMGVSPHDLITLFQAMQASGALHAEVIIQ